MPWIESHNTQAPLQWILLIAVFLLSLSSLSFEVLLTRIFSISQWHHLTFMVLSIALFGFAASGTVSSILGVRNKQWQILYTSANALLLFAGGYVVAVVGAFVGLNLLPLDYFKLPVESIQIFYLLLAYLLLTLPFFLTGFVIALAFSRIGSKAGYVYFATMAGSACGAVLPVVGLTLTDLGLLIIWIAMLPFFGLLICLMPPIGWYRRLSPLADGKHIIKPLLILAITMSAIIGVFFSLSDFFKVKSSDYKALSQLQQFPDTRIAKSVHGIRGRFDLINSPYNRFAPGLSLTYAKSLPRQTVVFKDGDRPFYLYHISSSADLEFIKHTISYCGYHLHGRPDRILVVESGGGMGIICALAAQPKHIDIVAPEKDLAAFIQSHYHRHTVSQPIRSYLKQANHRYDIIQIDDWGPTVPGAASLSQSHSFTKEAFIEYLRHLKPGGMLIITRKLLLPPADSLRLWATAYDSLRKLQIRSPHRCIAIFRNWDTFTLLVSNRSISSGPQTLSFLEKRNFDIVYLDDAPKDLINRFAIFDHPYHYLQIKHLSQAFQNSVEKQYFDSYLMDVVPQNDKRPYPSRFLKWKRFGELYQTTGSRLYSLMMSGDIVVWVVFGEALLIAVLLLIIPSVILKRKQSRPHKGQTLFFLSVGAGFMFVEVFFIKRLILIFEDPVTSFTLTVTAVLIFSAVGGYWSQRWHRQDLPKLSLLIIAVLSVQLLIVDVILEYAFDVRSEWQYVIAVITILPVGIIMGIPFPLAVRTMAIMSVHRSHAWAANGASSVLTSIVAMQLALSYGIQYILFAAIGAYLLAFIGAMVSRHDTESS